MSSRPVLSIVICSYNRAAYIVDAVESLRLQTAAPEAFEVIVVDNNSSDDTLRRLAAYMTSHPDFRVTILQEKRQGASYARNLGASKAVGDWLCFMDDDAVATEVFVEKILAFTRLHPGIGGLGGRIIPKYLPQEPAWMSYHVSSLVGHFHFADEPKPFAGGKYPLESNMTVRKDLFDRLGGFNTALPGVQGTLRIGGEGKDFFLRLYALGETVWYSPDVVVHHVVDTHKLTREYMYRVASGIGRGERVRMKALGSFAFAKKILEYLYKLAGSVVLGLVYALRGRPAQTLPVIRFRWDALKGLLGF